MERKEYKTRTTFAALSEIGGLYTVINGASIVVLSLFLYNKFWSKEAINIMMLSGQDDDVDDKMKVEATKKKLQSRFSYASIFGLFDATTYLQKKQKSSDQ